MRRKRSREVREPEVRVALVTPSLKLGGLERMVHDLALALPERGYRADIFVTQDLGVYAENLRRSDVRIWDCRAPRLKIAGLPLRLLRSMARFQPAIIHGHSGTWLPCTVAKLTLRSPWLVFTDHGRYPPEPKYRALIERHFFHRNTSRLVAVSGPLAGYLQDFLKLPTRPVVIQNGVDLTNYGRTNPGLRNALRSEWGVAPEEVVAISVGRLEPVKNHVGLLRALAGVADRAPRLRLAIVGAGRLSEDLQVQARRLGIQPRVRFLGYRSDVPDCLRAADLFVSASTTEGLPVSLLEAMAAGLPVVSSAVGGIPEALGRPPAGILVPAGDISALGDALARLAADPGCRRGLGRLARERSHSFSLETCVQKYCELYRALLSRDGVEGRAP